MIFINYNHCDDQPRRVIKSYELGRLSGAQTFSYSTPSYTVFNLITQELIKNDAVKCNTTKEKLHNLNSL